MGYWADTLCLFWEFGPLSLFLRSTPPLTCSPCAIRPDQVLMRMPSTIVWTIGLACFFAATASFALAQPDQTAAVPFGSRAFVGRDGRDLIINSTQPGGAVVLNGVDVVSSDVHRPAAFNPKHPLPRQERFPTLPNAPYATYRGTQRPGVHPTAVPGPLAGTWHHNALTTT